MSLAWLLCWARMLLGRRISDWTLISLHWLTLVGQVLKILLHRDPGLDHGRRRRRASWLGRRCSLHQYGLLASCWPCNRKDSSKLIQNYLPVGRYG